MSISTRRDTAARSGHALAGWTPIQMRWEDDRPVIRWCFTEGIEFSDPFFDQTIERCLLDPFRLLFWRDTGIEALSELARESPGLAPSGFVFHMSRCGSTLVAQMLAALPSALVLSEPPPVDTVLRTAAPEETLVEWLRGMIAALAQPRRPEQSRLVVKLDAWAIFALPLIRAAFPDAGCIFLYRDPVEVVVSQLERRGYHTIPGVLPPQWFGIDPADVFLLSGEEYCAAVVGAIGATALDAARAGALLPVPYHALPQALPDVIAPHFGFEVGPAELAVFERVGARTAKNPAVPFTEDTAEKQRRATPEVRRAVEHRAATVPESLEHIWETRR
jgi:hypothetical protein